MNTAFDSSQLFAYAPMLLLVAMGCVILIAETFARASSRTGLAWLGVASCVGAMGLLVAQWPDAATPTRSPARRNRSV